MEITVALDAMGGDHSPESIVEGVRTLGEDRRGPILLAGQGEAIERCGPLPAGVEVVPAATVVDMHEPPSAALRRKPDSSVAVAAGLVRQGRAQAVISAGNTGAFMAFCVKTLGRLKGIQRPAIATLMPTHKEPCILIDVGANVDCRPDFLQDFAIMGKVYAEKVLGRPSPRVGLLNIGGEAGKGNELTNAASVLLESTPLHFIGNVEGRDISSGDVDVVVCDGFVGNVILKYGEGLAEMIFDFLKEIIAQVKAEQGSGNASSEVFKKLMNSTDYAEYGGAPLLGVGGASIVCHGKSSPKAIANAIRVAYRFVEQGVTETISREVSAVHHE
jgi:phosphate acyltransferase